MTREEAEKVEVYVTQKMISPLFPEHEGAWLKLSDGTGMYGDFMRFYAIHD